MEVTKVIVTRKEIYFKNLPSKGEELGGMEIALILVKPLFAM